jgi:hypothetical protein
MERLYDPASSSRRFALLLYSTLDSVVNKRMGTNLYTGMDRSCRVISNPFMSGMFQMQQEQVNCAVFE